MFGRFRKPAAPKPVDPVDRFHDALKELNEAWNALPDGRVRPWIIWEERLVVAATYGTQMITREEHRRMK